MNKIMLLLSFNKCTAHSNFNIFAITFFSQIKFYEQKNFKKEKNKKCNKFCKFHNNFFLNLSYFQTNDNLLINYEDHFNI